MKTIETKIFENVKAYDIYDQLLKELIHLQFEVKANEKLEKYEVCQELINKINNTIAFRSVQISRMINTSSDEVYQMLNEQYNDLKKEIEIL